MNIGTLPEKSLGFDCNTRVTLQDAKRFRAAGFSFAIRYVARTGINQWDFAREERDVLVNAGLGCMVVQHVKTESAAGWIPSAVLGLCYGENAGKLARAAGVPSGVNVWLDLEAVATSTPTQNIIDYCNEWHEAVERAGYKPGLYVGDRCGLSPAELYHNLLFEHYWGAYNLNADQRPAVRGLQMRQHPYPPIGQRVPDVSFEYDIDEIKVDALGGTPILLLAD